MKLRSVETCAARQPQGSAFLELCRENRSVLHTGQAIQQRRLRSLWRVSWILKLAPPFRLLATVIVPQCASTMRSIIERPSACASGAPAVAPPESLKDEFFLRVDNSWTPVKKADRLDAFEAIESHSESGAALLFFASCRRMDVSEKRKLNALTKRAVSLGHSWRILCWMCRH